MSPFPWTKPAPSGPRPSAPGSPRPASRPTPSKPRPKAHPLATVVQAVALVAAGLVLIVSSLTAPAPESKPLQLGWRTATEQEERACERQRLVDALDELRTQTPAVRPEPAPAGFDVPAGAGQDHPARRG